MKLFSDAVFLGFKTNTKKDNSSYNLVSICDDDGQTLSCKASDAVDLNSLQKFQPYHFTFEYNDRYSMISVIAIDKIGK